MKVNISKMLPTRFAQCTQGRRGANLFVTVKGIADGRGIDDVDVEEGEIVAILETKSGSDEFRTVFEALTLDAFKNRSEANPHLHYKAEFFKRAGKSWQSMGYGSEPYGSEPA